MECVGIIMTRCCNNVCVRQRTRGISSLVAFCECVCIAEEGVGWVGWVGGGGMVCARL